MKRLLIALALALGVSGCGFQPVYAPSGTASFAAGNITVAPIPGRSGYMLRRALQQELAAGLPNLDEPARLEIGLSEELLRLAFKPDGAADRSSYIGRASFTLSTESKTFSGSTDAEVGFAVPDAPYGDISAQTSAADRTMRLLASRIVDDLRLKLSVAN